MITHKQYPNHHIFETEIGGRTFTVETGKVAELCNAEAICRYGDTVVLVTAVASPLPKAGIDYFPLTIEVEERMYAVGRIPGSFNRREGKPSDRGVLISRLIDRPMRPLFDEELRNDVVLTNTILAQDYDNPVEIVASIGSSLVIAYSDIPWNGPTATTNVCYLDGKYIVNPSQDERNACQCFVTIASTHEKVVMIETEANEVKEDILMECIKLAHETNVKVVEFINTIVDAIGKPKFTFEKAAVNHEMLDDLCEYGLDKIAYALDTDDKNVREERLTAAVVDFKEKFGEKYADDFHDDIGVHLDETAVGVVSETRVLRLLCEGDDDLVVETEVQDRIHHAGHGSTRAGTDGNEQRVIEIAELLAGHLFELFHVLHDLRFDLMVDLAVILVVLRAGFGGDGEALRDRHAKAGHFGQIGALAAEQLAHFAVAFGEQIYVLVRHLVYPFPVRADTSLVPAQCFCFIDPQTVHTIPCFPENANKI